MARAGYLCCGLLRRNPKPITICAGARAPLFDRRGMSTVGVYSGASCAGAVDFFGDGQAAAADYFSQLNVGDPPLPNINTAIPIIDSTNPFASNQVAITANTADTSLTVDVTAEYAHLLGDNTLVWRADAETTFPFSSLSNAAASVYQNGSLVGLGG